MSRRATPPLPGQLNVVPVMAVPSLQSVLTAVEVVGGAGGAVVLGGLVVVLDVVVELAVVAGLSAAGPVVVVALLVVAELASTSVGVADRLGDVAAWVVVAS